jgi:hypothetical protein
MKHTHTHTHNQSINQSINQHSNDMSRRLDKKAGPFEDLCGSEKSRFVVGDQAGRLAWTPAIESRPTA